MKVYGGNVNTNKGQKRGIFAGTKKALAAVMGGRAVKPYIRDYWVETGNKIEVEAATKQPGVLLVIDGNRNRSGISVEDYKTYKR